MGPPTLDTRGKRPRDPLSLGEAGDDHDERKETTSWILGGRMICASSRDREWSGRRRNGSTNQRPPDNERSILHCLLEDRPKQSDAPMSLEMHQVPPSSLIPCHLFLLRLGGELEHGHGFALRRRRVSGGRSRKVVEVTTTTTATTTTTTLCCFSCISVGAVCV